MIQFPRIIILQVSRCKSTIWGLFLSLCATSSVANTLHFYGIENLSEQEVGKMVFEEICLQLNLKVRVTLLPADRAERGVLLGNAAGEIMRIDSYGDNKTNVVRIPTPYYSLKTTAFSLTTNLQNQALVHQIEQANIAIVRGVKHTEFYANLAGNVMQVMTTKQMMRLLELKRIDLAVTSYIDGLQYLNQKNINHIIPLQPILAEHALYIYLNQRYASLVPLFDEKIKQLIASGELEKLIQAAENQVMSVN
ncbi:substrate-binding periplasmic protein [Shewanella intestini]|uniref:Transporter substrate-binding domain-containing protein n=1 Tax=Shewanella intestini TaxID=2017544 RepID=A0ABS5I646_9GAMM|nr:MULTISPECIES: transporter substrate-binding domain-containing protein [Shewanella]MBR9728810.1 transporter substrate-binding domain-containing protein [Shewanella intestini]MRG36885.1 transporter substrate-binding domain-containing protein [Shewanella sp. XMDDZSB0408]